MIREFYDTAFEAGIPIVSSDKCCRILSWLYIFGGGCEQAVLDAKFNSARRRGLL